MPRADRMLPFNERLARHEHSGTPRVSPPTLKKRMGSIKWVAAVVGFGTIVKYD